MAMIIDAFVGRYINLLSHLVEERVVLILGVKDELRKLQRRLERMKSVLMDAEKRRIQDSVINTWLIELKDVMYDADDIIDLCRIEGNRLLEDPLSASRFRPVCLHLPLFSCFSSAEFHHEIGNRIRGLNERLDEISNDKLMFTLEYTKPNFTVSGINPRQTSPLIESDVVGRDIEDATKALVELLVREEKQNCCVYGIVGMGGIGKTTLAQKIYNDPRIRDTFPTRIWVCVSQSFSETDLLKETIRSAAGSYGEAKTKAELQPMLAAAVSGKRFFLVLDDVWQEDVWIDLLRNPLKNGSAVGRILATSRLETVVKKMGAVNIHHLKLLPTDYGWQLLCKKVFANGEEEEEIQSLREVGMQIVEKCHGLPLAIKTIAGVLTTKDRSRREWKKVLRSDAWSLDELPKGLTGALFLSYEDLPSHLKQCFLYCSLFPEDHVFHRYELVRLWVAEGFVSTQEDPLMEDLAEDYYSELIARSLLEPDPIYYDHSRCKMHDLLRSLAQFLSRDESFYGDARRITLTTRVKLRRLSITEWGERAEEVPDSISEQKCLRTLMLLRSPPGFQSDKLVRLPYLRVLVLNGTGIESIPDTVGNLVHLRLLDLNRSKVSNLPNSLGRLTNLQILNLIDCKFLHALPKSITKLCNLRCLRCIGTPLCHWPKGIGRLERLNDLSGFVIASDDDNIDEQQGCFLEELRSLSLLQYLNIHKLERELRGSPILNDKLSLKVVQLNCTLSSSRAGQEAYTEEEIDKIEEIFEELRPPPCLKRLQIRGFFGRGHPRWMLSSMGNYLPQLTHLSLANCMSCLRLPPLGELPQLRYLRIAGASAVVTIGPEFLSQAVGKGVHASTSTMFPKLEMLRIQHMPNWEIWTLTGERGKTTPNLPPLLPRLRQLSLENCPKLRFLPEGLQQATMMQSLVIKGARNLRGIENLPFLTELHVENNCSLERVSNLPILRSLKILTCPALERVENLDGLQRLQLDDPSMERLPKWLSVLLRQRQHLDDDRLELNLVCSGRVLKRCLIECSDWPVIQQISQVSAYAETEHGRAHLFYVKTPFRYQTNL